MAARATWVGLVAVIVLAVAGCGSGSQGTTGVASNVAATTTTPTTTTTIRILPGLGRPPIAIGDKNFTEQFVLGELYFLALGNAGYDVTLNRNIGPMSVTLPALKDGTLNMYPEYLNTFNSAIAGYRHGFPTADRAMEAAQHYAATHGLVLLPPTPFADSQAIAVTTAYARRHHLRSLGDLRRVATTLTLGAPPQFQQAASGLPAIEQAYGFVPATTTTLDVGAQYPALDSGAIQAAWVNSTDAQLSTGKYIVLRDPQHVLGFGNVVPVVTQATMASAGPGFMEIIEQINSMLTMHTIRQLNAAVDLQGEDPKTAARQFLQNAGILPLSRAPSS
jgi:osmoprotectant transport system substrate-binding protein